MIVTDSVRIPAPETVTIMKSALPAGT